MSMKIIENYLSLKYLGNNKKNNKNGKIKIRFVGVRNTFLYFILDLYQKWKQ